MNNTFPRNYVFISYNHKDVKWAKWLQRRLEWYRLPAEIHNEFSDSRFIRPVFRDRDNLTSGVLNDELRTHLEASKYLVVICSPNSAKSEWVSNEVRAFIEMGRLKQIVPFIVDGSSKESLPLALRQWNEEQPQNAILGIAVTDDGRTDKEKAFIRLVSYLLGVEFDSLWQRHRRFVRRIAVAISALAILATASVYWFMIPVQLSVRIKDEPSQLPGMERGTIFVDGSEYSINHPDTTISISSLPGYYRLGSVDLRFRADRFYLDIDKTIHIGPGIHQSFTLQLSRDDSFAVFAGTVYDGDADDFTNHPVCGASITVGQFETRTDDTGHFRIEIPLPDQLEVQPITIESGLFMQYVREDECPSENLVYLLHR